MDFVSPHFKLAFVCITLLAFVQIPVLQDSPIQFRKQMIASESFESVGVFDVNNDKLPDLVSGAFWYEGPGFVKRHVITQPTRFGEFYNDFSTIPMDVDGDGWIDFITGGWNDQEIYWRKNPEAYDREWKNQTIGKTGNVETTRAWDIDGDGVQEIVPNNPGRPLKVFRLITNAKGKGTGKFTEHVVWESQGHGLGFGDLDKDGRGDLIISNGWLEAPQKPFSEKWIFHEEFNLGKVSIPILVTDVNGDGTNDFIGGQGHDYGLHWYEQRIDASGSRSWYKHAIDPSGSQYHTMEWTDLDNDGRNELITGKRYRAHNDDDPGAADAIGLYYFKWNGKSFDKNIISYGILGEGKGTGNYFSVADVNNDNRKDIIVAGKDGLFVFYNEGVSTQKK
jgi:hypothetical protein